jgi:hypothetical protein
MEALDWDDEYSMNFPLQTRIYCSLAFSLENISDGKLIPFEWSMENDPYFFPLGSVESMMLRLLEVGLDNDRPSPILSDDKDGK